MLFHLALDAGAEAVQVRVANPVGCRLHAAGDLVAHLGHATVVLESDSAARAGGRAGEVARRAAASLAETIGARVERVGERVLQVPRAVAHRRSDVGQLFLRRAGYVARAIGEALRLLVLGSRLCPESLADVGRGAGAVTLRAARVPGVPIAGGSARILRSTALARRGSSGRVIVPLHTRT